MTRSTNPTKTITSIFRPRATPRWTTAKARAGFTTTTLRPKSIVDNDAPTVSLDPIADIFEHESFFVTGTVHGPSATSLTLSADVNFDGDTDDAGEQVVVPVSSGVSWSFSTSFFVPDDGASGTWDNGTASDSLSISAEVSDGVASDTANTSIAVKNVAPVVTIDSITPIDNVLATDLNGFPTQWLNPGQLDESEGFKVSGTVTDPGVADAHTVKVEVDLNFDGDVTDTGESVNVALTADPSMSGQWTFEHTITDVPDDGPSPGNDTSQDTLAISVFVEDDDSGTDTQNANVVVENVAPSLPNDVAVRPDVTLDIDTKNHVLITVSGVLIDPGKLDYHNVSVEWGNGATDMIQILPGDGTFSITREVGPALEFDDEIFPTAVEVTDDDSGQIVYNFGCRTDPVVTDDFAEGEHSDGAETCHRLGISKIPKFVQKPTKTVNYKLAAPIGNLTFQKIVAQQENHIRTTYFKGFDKVQFNKTPDLAGLEIYGWTILALGVKYQSAYEEKDGTCTCNYEGAEFAFMGYSLVFSDRGDTDKLHIGNGIVINGPKNTVEHESWHVDGVPDGVAKDASQKLGHEITVAPGSTAMAKDLAGETVDKFRKFFKFYVSVKSIKEHGGDKVCQNLLNTVGSFWVNSTNFVAKAAVGIGNRQQAIRRTTI